jgi:hypothetical protein
VKLTSALVVLPGIAEEDRGAVQGEGHVGRVAVGLEDLEQEADVGRAGRDRQGAKFH